MKLHAFRIKNFRSIIDSGWSPLAPDNITVLIGQNESGKTSVLEALRCFFSGQVTDDMLRSDNSLPEVSCTFVCSKDQMSTYMRAVKAPAPLAKLISDNDQVTLARTWDMNRSARLFLANEPVVAYYRDRENTKNELVAKVEEQVREWQRTADDVFSELEAAEKTKESSRLALAEAHKVLLKARKRSGSARKPDEKIAANENLPIAEKGYTIAEEKFTADLKFYEQIKEKIQLFSEKFTISRNYTAVRSKVIQFKEDISNLENERQETLHLQGLVTARRNKRTAHKRAEQLLIKIRDLQSELSMATGQEEFQCLVAAEVLKGKSLHLAESDARIRQQLDKGHITAEELGKLFFEYLPVFELFEDFSSLLPDKIDLEDILSENTAAQGYKAATNFLLVSGLKPEFFREQNHRILQQRIETLNNEITVDFQDYWRQNLGQGNKIRINFELEYYPYTHPDKSGKPYMEFWIKDKAERLYPKQRSRGVRWFLSFYLELKATSLLNGKNRVLLIDEPGLSLHTRAQEDVLKVFEDLKEKMQIVYTTHSPSLIDAEKLYRLLAVQRLNEEDERSQTVLIKPGELANASADTLSPIYAFMGGGGGPSSLAADGINVIVEDYPTALYLSRFCEILNISPVPSFIPAAGEKGILNLSSLLLGWRFGLHILLFDTPEAQAVKDEVSRCFFPSDPDAAERAVKIVPGVTMAEDLLSTLDFKRYLLQQRLGITGKNSDFIRGNNLSRAQLATGFITLLSEKGLSDASFDEETLERLNGLKRFFTESSAAHDA